MGERARIGLIPLYLALYDEVAPQYRPQMEAFAQHVASRLAQAGGPAAAGLEAELVGVCCIRAEVERAIADLAARRVDLLATLHLAYSPSLESAPALVNSPLPLVLLDTTPAPRFADQATIDDMFRNHGIHGVQDLACVLRRRGRPYCVVAGHIGDEGFLRQAAEAARAARAVRHLKSMRVLLVGEEFAGMGDFAVEPSVLATTLGIIVRRVTAADLGSRVAAVADADLDTEAAADAERFDCSRVSAQLLRASNRVGLALRQMLVEFGARAFSFNFRSLSARTPGAMPAAVPTVPFLEASKAMARGIGYAGENDALTAALVGALLSGWDEVTFTEMFCPDWAGNAIFMSHMGECNPALAAARPMLVEKDYVFGSNEQPVVTIFPLRPGAATLVNLAPGPDNTFRLIASRVRILDRGLQAGFPDVPHFWVQPAELDLCDFLRRYSELGGTHHLALVLGDEIAAIRCMAEMLGVGFAQV